ncbi:MAG: hypothetical protein JNK04_10045 [Myxococcales bacterium]|nr:hypothetical protein [Myxococcales bacterium]
MSALKRSIPFLILGGVAAMVGGGVYAYNRAETNQKRQRDQAFTDLSQCLMGDIVASGDDTLNKISRIQNRAAHRGDEASGESSGSAWPGRCATITRDMSDSVRTSSFLDETAKRDLLKELERLQKDLEQPSALTADLGLPILALWRVAEKHKVEVTRSSNVEGPPIVPSLENADKAIMPFSGIQTIANGPAWAYLVNGVGPNKHGVCSLTGDALACKVFEHEGGFYPIGTWSSPTAIPFGDGQGNVLLFDGAKLVKVETKFSGTDPRLHVSENGTLYMAGTAFVGEEVQQRLVVRTAAGKMKSANLEKALDKASEGAGRDAITATILGENVLIRRTAEDGVKGELQLFPIGEDATLTEGEKMPRQGNLDTLPSICRVAAGFALDLSVRQTTLMFYDKGRWSGPMTSAWKGLGCAPSGVWVGNREVCNPSGCSEAIDWSEIESFQKMMGTLPASTKIGDKLVIAWSAREGSGLMVRVSDKKKTASEVFVSETSSKSAIPEVIADTDGALVFGETGSDKKLVGVRVKADGSVVPLAVTME